MATLNEYNHQSYKLEILGAIPKATTKKKNDAPLAQCIEHFPSKERVIGWNPIGGAEEQIINN